MQMKKVLAVLMSFCMVAGSVSYGAPIIAQNITAHAESANYFSYDQNSGVMFLRGEVDGEAVRDFCYRSYVKTIVALEGTVLPEDCSELFKDYKYCITIDLSDADTSNVTNMRGMFSGCSGLTTLNVSGFDTSSVTNMATMFSGCSELTELDVSGFNTSNVEYMGAMFSGCKSLTSLDVSGFDTGNVKDMGRMFTGCFFLTTLDVNSFDTSNVTNMGRMFESCNGLTSIDISGLNTSKVTNMSSMFEKCYELTSINISGLDTANVKDMSRMFSECKKLSKLDLTGLNTAKVKNMDSMFSNCCALTTLDLSGFNTSNVSYMGQMFYYCTGLSELDVSVFDTNNVIDMTNMFGGCRGLTKLDLSTFDTSNVEYMTRMFYYCSGLKKLDISGFDTGNVTNMDEMFYECSKLTSLDVSGFDTSNVESMSFIFANCSSLTSIDVSGFDIRNATNIAGMFYYCSGLTSIDVSSFDTSNVESMISLFNGCSSLTSIDVSGFDTKKTTNMGWMFGRCSGLTELDVSGFDTSKVTYMHNMFDGCSGLTELDLSNFDTRKVIWTHNMFKGCTGLSKLDLSSFDTSKVTDMYNMFSGCSGLETLDLSSFDTSKVKDMGRMFKDCNNLKNLTLGKNFKRIKEEAELSNEDGWVNANATSVVVSGSGEFADIENKGNNTYNIFTGDPITYPTNIKVEYNDKYRQVRFTWDKVKGADSYGIAVYLAGKWKVQAQNITDTVYTSPKNLTPGKTYQVAIAARVNGKWDTANAIKNAVTCTIVDYNSYVKPDREIRFGSDLYVIADEITMYLGPDTSYGKVTTIPGKTSLQELGVMNNNDNWAFTAYKGKYGWVQVVNEFGERQIQIKSLIVKKPVIYLYPEKETNVHVEVELTEADLSTTYPKYNNGWDVVAKPDGSLVNKADGTHHRYLFWDAVNCRTEFDFSKGFCVAGSDTESFLKEKLTYMGLTEDEMNEFIVYWLPQMEHNKYNLISFQSDKYTDTAKLKITPEPDSMLRVFMTYVPLEEAVDIEPQELSTFERKGFTVVEWGGSEI